MPLQFLPPVRRERCGSRDTVNDSLVRRGLQENLFSAAIDLCSETPFIILYACEVAVHVVTASHLNRHTGQ